MEIIQIVKEIKTVIKAKRIAAKNKNKTEFQKLLEQEIKLREKLNSVLEGR